MVEGGEGGRRATVWEVSWEGLASVRFGPVPDVAVRFGTGAGGSIRCAVKVLLKWPCKCVYAHIYIYMYKNKE